MLVNVLACAPLWKGPELVDVSGREAVEHLAKGRQLLAGGDYGGALKETEAVLSLAGDVPRQEALFQIGLIEAHPANPARNQEKALAVLGNLVRDYPAHPLAMQAQILSALIRESEQRREEAVRSNRGIAELKQENERLTQTIEKLNRIIAELRQVDIDVEQKKRGKGR